MIFVQILYVETAEIIHLEIMAPGDTPRGSAPKSEDIPAYFSIMYLYIYYFTNRCISARDVGKLTRRSSDQHNKSNTRLCSDRSCQSKPHLLLQHLCGQPSFSPAFSRFLFHLHPYSCNQPLSLIFLGVCFETLFIAVPR